MANRNEKEASRKRILSTCVRLFLEQGFKHTPPKQILTGSGIFPRARFIICTARKPVCSPS